MKVQGLEKPFAFTGTRVRIPAAPPKLKTAVVKS